MKPTRERGATLVEFSVVMPILLLVMIGIMEFGIAFKDFLLVSGATREGARLGAFVGDDPTSDCTVAQGVEAYLGSDMARVQRIEIFEADPDGNQISANTNEWTLTGDPADCLLGWSVVERWPAASRNVTYGPSNPLDIIGVRILFNRSWITGFPPFIGSYTVNENTVTRIEPEAFE